MNREKNSWLVVCVVCRVLALGPLVRFEFEWSNLFWSVWNASRQLFVWVAWLWVSLRRVFFPAFSSFSSDSRAELENASSKKFGDVGVKIAQRF